jgi:succinate dehydrogenase/fumarate reductase cytochrome b subunit
MKMMREKKKISFDPSCHRIMNKRRGIESVRDEYNRIQSVYERNSSVFVALYLFHLITLIQMNLVQINTKEISNSCLDQYNLIVTTLLLELFCVYISIAFFASQSAGLFERT